ncbi:hypothetical protein F5J12DRAFT_918912 [Pisolithus orientalis]|uniref:uncharacterized protein n=1 Tax=Pisolithus orientalis TaxID=936130 RepID=UPI0022256DDD|nr:uncharacterized protein F5J12DRAFT_918912 [Pisolithus orientalis]KAI6030803.1 hypothetical protein F5J12DRAFT_918912 [Pisolithus orientalis]
MDVVNSVPSSLLLVKPSDDNKHPSYTILRIKRKRTEEPLDALVVESRSRRKKSRGGGLDVFQFAQTVETDAWDDVKARQNLQVRLWPCSRHISQASPVREVRSPDAGRPMEEGNRRYTVRVAEEDTRAASRRRPTSPPKVISAKDASQNDFKMYDAVPADQEAATQLLDLQMENFSAYAPGLPQAPRAERGIPATDDYVWDVFYRRPYSLDEWRSLAANVGTLTGLPAGPEESEEEDEADEDSNAEEYYKNDYPDEESGSDDDGSELDIFHEDSDHDESLYEDSSGGEDHLWR